jgi:hypothetical protein
MLLGQVRVGHAQHFRGTLDLGAALQVEVVDVRHGQLVLEEALVVVPGLARLGGAVGQPLLDLRVADGFAGAGLGGMGEERKVQTLDGLRAFDGELGADAAFVLEAGDLMATGAAKVPDPPLALGFQLRVIHEGGGVGVGRRLALLV